MPALFVNSKAWILKEANILEFKVALHGHYMRMQARVNSNPSIDNRQLFELAKKLRTHVRGAKQAQFKIQSGNSARFRA